MAALSILTKRHPRIALVIHKGGQQARGDALRGFDAAIVRNEVFAAIALDFSPFLIWKVLYVIYRNHLQQKIKSWALVAHDKEGACALPSNSV